VFEITDSIDFGIYERMQYVKSRAVALDEDIEWDRI